MPRTAVTHAKTHKGEWRLIAHRDVPFTKQISDFRGMLAEKSHPEFSIFEMQESDGHLRTIKLRSPKEQKSHDDSRAAEHAAAKAAGEAEKVKADEGKKSETIEPKTENK